MKFLGISASSVCGGATLMAGGNILASVNEERLDRFKLSTGFPSPYYLLSNRRATF